MVPRSRRKPTLGRAAKVVTLQIGIEAAVQKKGEKLAQKGTNRNAAKVITAGWNRDLGDGAHTTRAPRGGHGPSKQSLVENMGEMGDKNELGRAGRISRAGRPSP